jgi:hypothetical protein
MYPRACNWLPAETALQHSERHEHGAVARTKTLARTRPMRCGIEGCSRRSGLPLSFGNGLEFWQWNDATI